MNEKQMGAHTVDSLRIYRAKQAKFRKVLKPLSVIAFTLLAIMLIAGTLAIYEYKECTRWAISPNMSLENPTETNILQWQVDQCNNYNIKLIK